MIIVYRGTTWTKAVFPDDENVVRMVGSHFKSAAREYEMDTKTKKFFPTKRFYLFSSNPYSLVIPRGFTDFLYKILEDYGFSVETHSVDPVEPDKVEIPMAEGFQLWEKQIAPVKFLSNNDPGMYALPLQTGEGKTCIAIKTISNLGQRAMVIASGLIDQWLREFSKFTSIDDVYTIQGYKSLSQLMASDMKPRIFLCSLQTLRRFVLGKENYAELPMSYNEFLRHYGIGTKVADEVHEQYHSIVMTDLLSNIKNNIYLSATFTRNDRKGKKIFNIIYPPGIMCGTDPYKRYTRVTMYSYAIEMPRRTYIRVKGYMHAKYEAALLTRSSKFRVFMHDILKQVIDAHFLNIRTEDQKLLIYFQTNEIIDRVQTELKELYPEFKIVQYIGDATNDVYEDPEVDVILSSPKKAGIGTDIPNLRTIINTVSTQAETTLIQMLGRLRKLPEHTPEFIDLYNRSVPRHVAHSVNKKHVYQVRAVEFTMDDL